ncbi:MAG: adenylate/guanylate cyclase domain-containing protein [Jhaorihella sp.]
MPAGADQDFADSPELAAIVRRYLFAYGANDVDTLLNFYSDSRAVLYQGTAEDKLWDGSTFKAIMPAYVQTKPTFRIHDLEVRAFERGDTGFAVFRVELEFASGKAAVVRGTHLYTLARGRWQLVHAHHSSPLPNTENMGYEARGVEELLRAAAGAPLEIGQTGMASVMFTDIVDSSTIAESVGDSIWSAAVQHHLEDLRGLIDAGGGRVVKSLGDGTMSTFPTARRALETARAVQRSVATSDQEPRLPVRIGIHTGEVVDAGDDFFGTVINKAARVAALAGPGEVRLSEATRIMVGSAPDFSFGEPVAVKLRGLDGDHLIYRLEWQA